MDLYVIRNLDTQKFVAQAGEESSYTAKLQDARTFSDRAAASRHACGNERVLRVSEVMHQPDDSNR